MRVALDEVLRRVEWRKQCMYGQEIDEVRFVPSWRFTIALFSSLQVKHRDRRLNVQKVLQHNLG